MRNLALQLQRFNAQTAVLCSDLYTLGVQLAEETAPSDAQIATFKSKIDDVLASVMGLAELMEQLPHTLPFAPPNPIEALDTHCVALEASKSFNFILEAINAYAVNFDELSQNLSHLAYIQRIFNLHLDQTADLLADEITKGAE